MTVVTLGTYIECAYFNVDIKSYNTITFTPDALLQSIPDDYPSDFTKVIKN